MMNTLGVLLREATADELLRTFVRKVILQRLSLACIRTLLQFAYRSATTADFITLVQNITQNNLLINQFLHSFLYQPGYPLISAYWNAKNRTLRLTQVDIATQMGREIVSTDSNHGRERKWHLWTIPLFLRLGNNFLHTVWLTDTETVFDYSHLSLSSLSLLSTGYPILEHQE